MGPLIDTLYDVNWNSEIRTLLDDSRLFGTFLFGYVETIKTVTMVNYLDAGLYNLFELLDFFTDQITMLRVGRSMPRVFQICHQPWLRTWKIHQMCK